MKVELTDGAILLRPWREEDIDALYKAVSESFAELSQWMPWCHKNYQREDSSTFILSREEAWKNELEYGFAIIEPESGLLIGSLGINQVNRMYRMANLGYWVRTSRRGARRGLEGDAAGRGSALSS